MSQSCRPCRVIPFDFSMRVWPYEEEQASFESLFPDRIVSQPITPAASDRAKIESCWPVCCSVLAYANRRVASRELILFFFFPLTTNAIIRCTLFVITESRLGQLFLGYARSRGSRCATRTWWLKRTLNCWFWA